MEEGGHSLFDKLKNMAGQVSDKMHHTGDKVRPPLPQSLRSLSALGHHHFPVDLCLLCRFFVLTFLQVRAELKGMEAHTKVRSTCRTLLG